MDNLLNHAPCGFLSFRDDGTIVAANQTLYDLLGYSPPELEGRNIEVILTVASRIFYNTHFFPLIRLHAKADEIFLSLSGKSKNDIPVLTNAVRRVQEGEYANHCVFIPIYQRRKYEEEILSARKLAERTLKENEDLTSLTKKLESRTQELDRQYSKLLAINQNLAQLSKIVSHDLQEPIHKIQIFANILSTHAGETLDPKSKSAVQKITNAAERLRHLTSGLEQYVKVDTEKIYSTVDLNEVLAKAKSRAASERNFHTFDLVSDTLAVIEGYGTQLELLFYHLIDNSIQFRHTSRKLVIHVNSVVLQENAYRAISDKYRYVDHVKITFSDNGIGFENKYNEYVFDLVRKIDPETEGLGLGLALIKKIIDNHSGSIHAESDPGKGTRFTLLLPLRLN
jgi:phosphoserine phosphatase RsbU/P